MAEVAIDKRLLAEILFRIKRLRSYSVKLRYCLRRFNGYVFIKCAISLFIMQIRSETVSMQKILELRI